MGMYRWVFAVPSRQMQRLNNSREKGFLGEQGLGEVVAGSGMVAVGA